MEGLPLVSDGLNFQPAPLTKGTGFDEAPKIIQNFILKRLDDHNIELISCDSQDIQCFGPITVAPQNLEDLHVVTEPANTNLDLYKDLIAKPIEISVQTENLIKTPPRERPILSKPDRMTLDVTIYSCFKCSEQFNSLTSFRQHLKWHKSEKNFSCPKCQAGFNAENNLKIHLITSHPGHSDTCPICKIGFQRKASLKSHIMMHQVEELFVCEECHGEFQNDDELLKHMESHATTRITKALSESLVCPYCKLDYKTLAEYKQHIAKHVEVKKHVLKGKKVRKRRVKEKWKGGCKCKYCEKIFPKISLLERHERIHTGEKPFKCQFCDKAFAQKGTLQIHLDKHTGLKPYSCTLCAAKFSQKGNLRAHVEKTHTAPKGGHRAYKCSQCTCIFRKIATLNGHVTKVHLNQPEEDSQNIIDKVMDSLRELHSELGRSALKQDEVMSNDPTAPVNTAGMTLVKLAESQVNGDLKRYMVRQKKIGDVRWYFCNYCPRRFKKPSDLIRHFRTHTLEKPFACSKCHQAFSLKSTLVSHNKIHKKLGCQCDNCDTDSGREDKEVAPNFICLMCDQIFSTPEEAKNHRSEHKGPTRSNQNIIEPLLKQPLYQTAYALKAPKPKVPNTGAESPLERPHLCKICDARFTRLMSLKRHTLHHSGDRKFKCNLCSKAFVTKYRLKEHVNFHKNVKNFCCPTCDKKFVTSSLLKRHTIVHNSHRPYMCPYCDKHFKTLLLCRSHIRNLHKSSAIEEAKHKSQIFVEKLESVEYPAAPVGGDNCLTQEAISPALETPQATGHDSIILDVTAKSRGDQNVQSGYQMVYLDMNDLPSATSNPILNENHLMPSADPYLFGDLQDSAVFFSVDPNKSEMVDPNDVIKSADVICQPSSVDVNKRPEVERLPVISSVMSLANEQLQVDFGGLPISIMDASESAGELIPYDAQVFCINCHKMFSSYYVFEHHACADDAPTQTQDNFKLLLQEGATDLGVVLSDAPKSDFYENKSLTASENGSKLDLDKMKRFTYKKPLLADIQKLEESKKFSCKHCNFVTSFDDRFRKHILVHPDQSEKICKFCLKDFKKLSDLKRHLRTHTGEKPFECERCHKKFTLKSTLESHMRTHDMAGGVRIACDVCNSNFTSKSSLKVHMLLHTGARPHACNFCEQTFRTAAIRKAHEKNIHLTKSDYETTSKDKPKLGGSKLVKSVAEEVAKNVRKEAEDCQNLSSSKTEAAIVMNPVEPAVANDPMFFVQQIDNSGIILAPVPINLDDIALLDVGSLEVEIPHEDVKNQNSSAADVGKKSRTGQKPQRVECDICHKLYSSKDVLRKHKRTLHGQNRKFPCIKCDKGYDQLEDLQKHIMKLHTGHRPYSCQYCANSFSEENSLKTHIKRIHQKSLVGQETANALLGLQYDLVDGDGFL